MGSDAPRFHVPSRSLKPVRQIVIGTSLRSEDDATVRSGLALAAALEASAHVLHAVAWEAHGFPLGGSWPDASVPTRLIELRTAELAKVLAGTDPGRVTSAVEAGAPGERILSAAAELGAGLVVAGAGRHKRSLLGSTADRLMRRATCPVLIARDPLRVPPGRILAPVDLSELAADSFRCGLGFLHQVQAEQLGRVEALFVLSELTRESSGQFRPEQVDRFAREELERFVGEHAAELAGKVGSKLRVGDAREQILEEARQAGADLIVIGTHGRAGLERALIGSVTAGVAQGAPCSVLVIPPDVAFGAELVDAVAEQIEPQDWEVPKQETPEPVRSD
ncbi:MAG: universal stress protein [Acidobacteriota bacterium]|nr:universal stress protein [Acidobacteriota bacterium]MDH3524152.1 universal stress protein [Acidobacteriota bacterium]